MSKIDDLIRTLCPEGVPSQKLGNFIFELNDRAGFDKDFPVFGVSNTKGFVPTEELFTKSRASEDRSNYKVVKPNNFIYNPSRINVGSIARSLATTNTLVSPMYIVFAVADSVEPKFLECYLESTRFKSQVLSKVEVGARFRLPFERISEFKIQVPHIRVQREIVSILDKFTQLEAELEAELEARRTQYEVMRDRLLDFSGDLSAHPMGEKIRELSPQGVAPLPLGAFGEFVRGSGLEKKDLLTEGLPAVHYGEVHTHYGFWTDQTKSFVLESKAKNMKKAQPGDVVVVTTSEDEQDVGKPLAWVGQTDLNVGGESYIFKSKLDPFFTAQLFLSQAFKRQSRKYLSGTKVKRISSSNLEKLVVCIPPLEIQRRIGETLKAMDALVNDISIGLPAEIEARRKQYEHYRNRLLSFKELDAA